MTISNITKTLFVGSALLVSSMSVSANELDTDALQPVVEQSLEAQVVAQTEQVVAELQVQIAESLAASLASLLPEDLASLARGE
ncbi:hypothetical protein [Corallincola spongiicola]|uniref:DUF2059 domain-containing protein n=1 Tax=Corallincola spongiicola TaxID=2520508 RepID=A0ABY1WQU7_9GAMM|nr:hypothetical protein [Corallincola spongiicola]TAA47086.1 hypothetical protein EXY25_07520 [Corallincola spongiicola]